MAILANKENTVRYVYVSGYIVHGEGDEEVEREEGTKPMACTCISL